MSQGKINCLHAYKFNFFSAPAFFIIRKKKKIIPYTNLFDNEKQIIVDDLSFILHGLSIILFIFYLLDKTELKWANDTFWIL